MTPRVSATEPVRPQGGRALVSPSGAHDEAARVKKRAERASGGGVECRRLIFMAKGRVVAQAWPRGVAWPAERVARVLATVTAIRIMCLEGEESYRWPPADSYATMEVTRE